MLVITRRKGEELKIGDSVTVKILAMNGNRVSIGIEAPDDVRIVRGELKPQKDEEKESDAA